MKIKISQHLVDSILRLPLAMATKQIVDLGEAHGTKYQDALVKAVFNRSQVGVL